MAVSSTVPVVAADDRHGDAAGVALDQFGGRGQLVGRADLLHPELVTVRVDLTDVAPQRIDPGDADRDVGLALAPRATERVADDHGDVDAEFGEALTEPASRGVGIRRATPAPDRARRSTTDRHRQFAQQKPWCVSVISTGPIWRMIRFDSRSTTSTTRGSFSHRSAHDTANGDGSMSASSTAQPFGLRHDLRRDHDDVAVGERIARCAGRLVDLTGEIVTHGDLRQSGNAEDLEARHRQARSESRSACGMGERYPMDQHGAMANAGTAVSEIFDPTAWTVIDGFDFTDITYHRAVDAGVVRIAFDRPEVRNAFRPHTVDELYTALDHARMSTDVGCVLLTGNGPSPKDGGWAFCSGGDQRIRGKDGYKYAEDETADTIDPDRAGRLHILEVQRLIRFMPKVVICVVPGWAAGGGHSLHVVCDLTLASTEHARFKQTDADVASFDGGFGSAYLARQVGQKFAREIFFLGREYTADDMVAMGAVNASIPHAELEAEALQWGREICAKSPTAQRMLKFSFNLIDDGLVGQQVFAGEATRLAYGTDEAAEGRDSFLEKRPPDWSPYPYHF